MYCSHCGSLLKDTDSRCPYCGALNPIGAESDYMNRLRSIREETEDLQEVPAEEYRKTLKNHGKLSLKIAMGVIAFCLMVFLGIRWWISYQTEQNKGFLQKQMEFENKYFQKLNALYDQNDDDAVLAYLDELYGQEGSEALYLWEPMTYYLYVEEYQEALDLKEKITEDTLAETDLLLGFSCLLQLAYGEIPSWDAEKLTEDQMGKIIIFGEDCRNILEELLSVPEEEGRTMYRSCYDGEQFDYDKCGEYASEIYRKIKEEGT